MTTEAELSLAFPSFEYKLQKTDGKLTIYDEVSKKFRVLTPEEWVRQHCLHFFIHHLHYPANLIKLENQIKISQMNRRSDICVFDRQGNLFLMVECKAPHVPLDVNVLQQISQYQSKLRSNFWAITNGINH
ncbi:MAG: hypothetical protein RJA76_2182, partial [Bacteroidota bacterium]